MTVTIQKETPSPADEDHHIAARNAWLSICIVNEDQI
jgi:hypothetical protein